MQQPDQAEQPAAGTGRADPAHRDRDAEPRPTGPLVGVRVLEVGHAAAGPYAAMMLADLGADVIKVEPPGGELVRFAGPVLVDDPQRRWYGGRFANRNRNKRSIVLDLAAEDDREVFLGLVETSDGLIENMRAGVLDRLGVGWDACRARNPAFVYAAIRGFGDARTGASPYVDWPAYDVIAQAMGGFVSMTGPGPERPMRGGTILGDMVPGVMAALGLVSALVHARASGEGQFVDVAMMDAVMSICEPAQTMWDYEARDYPPSANGTDDVTPFDVYDTADGQCAIAAPTPPFWTALCRSIGRPEWADDERFATNADRVARRAEIDAAVGGWTAARSTAEVVEALGGRVPVGPVNRARDWVEDPHVAARAMLVEVQHPHHRPTTQLGCPIKATGTPPNVYRRPPLLDEHGAELRAELAAERARRAGTGSASGTG